MFLRFFYGKEIAALFSTFKIDGLETMHTHTGAYENLVKRLPDIRKFFEDYLRGDSSAVNPSTALALEQDFFAPREVLFGDQRFGTDGMKMLSTTKAMNLRLERANKKWVEILESHAGSNDLCVVICGNGHVRHPANSPVTKSCIEAASSDDMTEPTCRYDAKLELIYLLSQSTHLAQGEPHVAYCLFPYQLSKKKLALLGVNAKKKNRNETESAALKKAIVEQSDWYTEFCDDDVPVTFG